MKKLIVELTEKEWRMIRLSLHSKAIELERKDAPDADEYDALADRLYNSENYKIVEC